MNVNDLVLACVLITSMLAALVAVGRTIAWLSTTLRKLARMADDLTGEPARPGFPEGRPGVLDRLSAIENQLATLTQLEARLARVEAQLQPDGGSSLRDAVDRLESRTEGEAA